ncbi:uncharacterized protein LAESUDRAFT_731050 [Laetiporus sulphureus 93-53]|uniref:Uncharacterized protein n=1 Tax=Laetiporus sulphureus 93-53 TaxID=1314785 RepID=A0A165BTM5_9APHY|nr:uncharacterized protein LAESUDRAFT_731050 [Laetiporus sulphureus 93-53]KZT01629.1 hypothetical protein LAESUDRAFT_731050 [Laetiporus sulphureus 93-53]
MGAVQYCSAERIVANELTACAVFVLAVIGSSARESSVVRFAKSDAEQVVEVKTWKECSLRVRQSKAKTRFQLQLIECSQAVSII